MDQSLVRLHAAGVEGVDGYVVVVECARVEPSSGQGHKSVLGLPDNAVRESLDRIIPALHASGLKSGAGDRITVNLAPADRRKEGPAFDLAIALALAATHPENAFKHILPTMLFVAELGLDGTLRPVRGALAAASAAQAAGFTHMVVASENAAECAVVQGLSIYPCCSLRDVAGHLRSGWGAAFAAPAVTELPSDIPDMSDVRGQGLAKRALLISAAGGHNLLLIGPPGSGKTMLAKRLPGILPALSPSEALEVSRIHSVAGTLPAGQGLLRTRPFRSPHHSASEGGLVGGGTIPRPGDVTLAHHGVLFLDELPEFPRSVLETLRQPLEDGELWISRAWGRLRFPARCMLVAAMNPCPCGWSGHPSRACTDNRAAVARYRSRISGPLLDRIDLHCEVPAQSPADLDRAQPGEDSATLRTLVAAARERMLTRQGCSNAALAGKALRQHATPEPEAKALLHQAVDALGLSARAHDRIVRVARTIADLAESNSIVSEHVSEAIGYRLLDRQTW